MSAEALWREALSSGRVADGLDAVFQLGGLQFRAAAMDTEKRTLLWKVTVEAVSHFRAAGDVLSSTRAIARLCAIAENIGDEALLADAKSLRRPK